MENSNFNSPLVRSICNAAVLRDNELVLIDVGASGGLDSIWRQFEPHLRAYCFDPLTNEVNRLAALEKNPKVTYHAEWLSTENADVLSGLADTTRSTISFWLTSAARAQQLAPNYIRTVFNQGAELVYAEKTSTIDKFAAERGLTSIDFIKVDTDGHDYLVLDGASKSLDQRGVLGLLVECQLHGSINRYANTFANIDSFLRTRGFALFQMDLWRYTRKGLPDTFYYDLAAQTKNGQVQCCDAVYLLDPMTRTELFDTLSPQQFAKLLMLYDLFKLPDCAATLLRELKHRAIAIEGIDYDHVLDLLVPANPHNASTYEDYISAFERDATLFYPSKWAAAAKAAEPAPALQIAPAAVPAPQRRRGYFRNLWRALRGRQ